MSTSRRLERFECGHKVRHATKEAALRHLLSLKRKYGYSGNIYRCPWCWQYHVGLKRKRR